MYTLWIYEQEEQGRDVRDRDGGIGWGSDYLPRVWNS